MLEWSGTERWGRVQVWRRRSRTAGDREEEAVCGVPVDGEVGDEVEAVGGVGREDWGSTRIGLDLNTEFQIQ